MNRSEGQWVQPELSHNVYRGTAKLNPEEVGAHYSKNEVIAKAFRGHSKGVVINADIPMGSVETDTSTLMKKGVGNGYTYSDGSKVDEEEVTARTGAPIKVKSVQTLKRTKSGTKRTRTRTFNPPREMKA